MAAGYKDFTAGAVLTAADLEDYCQNQTVMRFASAAARDTALSVVKTEGMSAYLIDVNTVTVYTGAAWSTVGPVHGAWIAYTPTWTGVTGNGSVTGAYQRIGRTITYWAKVTWGSTTSHTATNQSLTFPVATRAYTSNAPLGNTSSAQTGVNCWFGSVMWIDANNYFILGGGSQTGTAAGTVTHAVPFTWANTHVLWVQGTYEAAGDA